MTSGARVGHRGPIRWASAAVLLVTLALTIAGTLAAHSAVDSQEKRLLKERTSEVGLVLNTAISDLAVGLHTQGGVLKATNGSIRAYHRATAAVLATAPPNEAFGWLRQRPGATSYVVAAAAGTGLQPGDLISDQRVGTLNEAMTSQKIVATQVLGADRQLGFALGPPAAPAGTVVYEQLTLGPIQPPQQANTAPFSELDVILYASTTPNPAQALVSTTKSAALTGETRSQLLDVGANKWLLVVKARRPLVGSATSNAQWFVLGFGLVIAALVTAIVESVARRRDAALAMYAGEHQVAETLQRNLLPRLPQIPRLQLAARYLPAGAGQQVGGDWFDAFALPDGSVGLVIGDVIGHDISAASAMSQIRAALRAYAVDGSAPATVVERLTQMVTAFDVTPLVTVFYGVLGPPAADGSRVIEYSNAGHLPPLVRSADGSMSTLDRAGSVVIGAPLSVVHPQAEHRLGVGSSLLLFTDGLVEAPGRSLDVAIEHLSGGVGRLGGSDDVERFCDDVIRHALAGEEPRDDVAVLAVRLT